jgi:hypothetical protein
VARNRSGRTTAQILGGVSGALADAEMGWRDLTGVDGAHRQMSGLKTMVTSGRKVTFILRGLSSTKAETFPVWYASVQAPMKADPLMRYLSDLRTIIEKTGLPDQVRAEAVCLREGVVTATAHVGLGEDRFGIWLRGVLTHPTEPAMADMGDVQFLRNIRFPKPCLAPRRTPFGGPNRPTRQALPGLPSRPNRRSRHRDVRSHRPLTASTRVGQAREGAEHLVGCQPADLQMGLARPRSRSC